MKNSLNFFITALLFIVFSRTAVYAQPSNDNCSTATAIGSLPAPTVCGTGVGVNTGATLTLNNQSTVGATAANPYVYLTACSGGGATQAPGLDTWYSFVATGSVVNITISGFPNASLGLWAGSCSNLRGAGCAIIPNSGSGTLTVSSIEIGKTYYIQISGNTPTDTSSNFSIAINNSIDCDDCLRVSTLTPSPLPVSGIYSPGQVVRFCYNVSQWKATNSNWFHGVQISMGAGWTGTITNTTPATSYVAGNWVFQPTGVVANGTNWGPGFYFSDGLNNWGDYRPIPQDWTFCFDLTVSSTCTNGDDLSVTINTSGDGESGSYPNPGCQQDPQNFMTSVKTQGPIVTSAIATTVCNGVTNFPLTSNVPATFNWIAIDNPNVLGESLTSQNSSAISDNLVNTSNVAQVVTYSVTAKSTATDLCIGVPQIVSITVKPSPIVIIPTSFSVCSGAIVPIANFASLPVGGTFTWTNNTPSIGLAASGTNFAPSFIASNTTGAAITATISVVLTLNGCVGAPLNYTITVNPAPTVSVPSPLVNCNNETVPSIFFASTPFGATFSWSTDITSIGMDASGTGILPGFIAVNTSLNPITATISVVPTLNGCQGITNAFTITVKPTPTVTVPSNKNYCVNAAVPATSFVSSPTLGTFTWTNNNANIGLAANGTGDIASFAATNTSANAITATISVTPTLNGCLGTSSTYSISVDAKPTVNTPTNAAFCNGATVPTATFTSATTGVTFDWTNDDTTIGLAASGTGAIPAFTAVNTTIFPIIATITVTPTTANGCVGTPKNYTITVNPTPTVAVPANDIYCNNTLVPATAFANTPTGGTFAWTNDNTSIGLAASGAGDIASFTAVNTTNATIIANITVTPTVDGCIGTASSYTITVDPSPTVLVPANAIYCNADSVLVANFVSSPAGGTFAWTNDTTNIGLAASGTGDISSFVATNTTSNQITANITVTATLNGCLGIPNTYTVKVDPTPAVSLPANADYCNNALVPAATFTSATTGATFTWTNDNSNIGLAASGTGDILAFTATNITSAPIVATITVTPITVNGCAGTPSSYSITVNPTPTVTVPSNNNYCVNAAVPATSFVSSPTLGTFTWTNNNLNIGLSANGTGDIPQFVATNTSVNAITATISVTPTVNGCLGTSSTYTISVDASPTVSTPASAAFCNGATVPTATFTSATTGVTFDWTNDDTTIGLAASGTGAIPAFTAVNTTIFPIIATITVTPTTANGCAGTPSVYTITVNPTPIVAVPANDIYCNNTLVPATVFANTPTGGTFAWINDNTSIGLAASGAGDIASFTAINTTNATIIANITVTPTVNGCIGTASSYTITVDPSPTVLVPVNSIYCNSDSVLVTNFVSSPAGGTFAWTNDTTNIGLAANGTGDISSFVATNTTSNQITASITVTATVNGCLGISNTYTVKVDPTPAVSLPANADYCNNALVPAATFTSATTGATFTWTNDNSNIGLAASGTGTVPSFTATNTTSAPIVATITVTPITVNGCLGTPSSYSITVNPTPTVTVPSNNNYCVNAAVPATSFVSTPTLGTFTWTNDNVTIGLATNGTGDIPQFVATNVTVNAITATISVTPTVNGCLGTSSTYTILVDATPTVSTPVSAAFCNGVTVPTATFTSATTGVTFDWTNDDTTIGLAASGTGAIPAFTAVNTTIFPIIATITVTPTTANGCAGTPSVYTITVNPTPTVVVPANDIYCNNTLVPATVFANTPTGGTFAWTNDNTSIGLAASGAGDISSFTAINTTNATIIANIAVTPTVNGCVGTASAYSITVNPSPTVSVPANAIYCNADSVLATNFVSSPAGGTFAWTNDTTNIGLAANGTGDISSFVATNTTSNQITASVTVTATVNGCLGISNTYTISVAPISTVVTPASAAYCNNATVPTATFTSATTGATFTWTNSNSNIGLAASGTGDILAFTATNTTSAPIVATITVTPITVNGCSGTPSSYSITVNPTPTVTVPSNNNYCVNAAVPATSFVSTPTLGTFTWTNNNLNIGLAANGTGDIPSFVATNTSANAITATISVTPTVNGCLGTTSTYSISVDATPTVSTPVSAAFCNGATVPTATFTSASTGVTFDWTNDDTTIGLAASGTGAIPAFTAVNTTIFPIIATITVTPTTANGCVGTPKNYTIIVNPTPTVTVPANDIYCNNTLVPAIAFANTPTGGTFAWTNDNTSIGLAASGAGDIATFTAINTTNAPIIANITVTPTVNGCIGTANSYSITVDPSPTVLVPANAIYCNSDSVPATNFVSSPAGGTFAWTNDTANIGLAASGTGDISSFLATNTTSNQITANITVTATVNGCLGISNTYTISVAPISTVVTPASAAYCNNATVPTATFTSATTGATFTWTNSNSNIGLVASGTGDILAFTATNTTSAPSVATITVTPITVNGCAGTPSSYSITVNPTPTVTVPSNNNYCVNAAVPATLFVSTPTLGTFTWTNDNVTIGLAANGTGDIPQFVATNTSANAITATISVTSTVNGCLGTSSSYTISVDATPTVSTPASAAFCNGAVIPTTVFTSLPSGATYIWSNSNPNVGLLATSGVGDLPSFVATNTSLVPITTTITVTPSLNGCIGTASIYTITVNPLLTVTTPSNASYCNNQVVPTSVFSSTATGVISSWTNDTPSIGIGSNGVGNIPTFLAANTTLSPVTATITVTSILNGCTGNVNTFTITVNPTPAVTVPINASYCTTATVPVTAFVGTLPSTTFTWTNTNTTIGLASASGSGNIGTFTATNTLANPTIAIIAVTPTANGCSGTPNAYTIIVNPKPTVNANAVSTTICSSDSTGIVLTGTPLIGTTFAWTAVASIGVSGASAGNGTFISQALTNSGTTIGNVVYTITPSANNCVGSPINTNVNVTPRPTISALPFGQNVCSGNAPNIVLSSTVLNTIYNWTVVQNNVTGASAGSGATIAQVLTATGLTAGQAIYTVTPNVNGCTGNPIIVTIVVSPIPVVIPLPLLGDVICSGQRTNITLTGGNPGTTFSWNSIPLGVSGATSGSGSVIAQTLSTTSSILGTVIYTITPSLNGCFGIPLPYPIVVNPTPEFTSIPPQLPLCSGDSTSIDLVPSINIPLGTTYAWTVIENGVTGASDDNGISINQILETTGTSAGSATYNVIPTLGTCSGNAINIIANVNPLPLPNLIDGVICVSASGNLLNPYLITTGVASSNHSFVWYLNNVAIIPAATGNNYLATQTGDYSVTITTNSTGCVASQTLVHSVVTATSPGLTLSAIASNEFTESAIITATVSGGTGVFEYSLDNGSFQLSNVFTDVLPGNHTVTVRDTSGCTDLTTNATVMGYQLFFTPNGDSFNDYWNIIGLRDQPNAKIYIFDRYGKLLVKINPKDNGWDGLSNGCQLPASDYWFSVEYTDKTTGDSKIFKSHFSLLR